MPRAVIRCSTATSVVTVAQLILCNIMAILALNFAQDGATAVNCNIEEW